MTKVLKKPVCGHCNSDRILVDAWAAWDVESQDWVLDAVFEQTFCSDCDGETTPKWLSVPRTVPVSGASNE